MQDLCPLCMKNGLKKKVKLLQINLQEAVWICEEKKCTWPLGYEDLVFSPRIVGKIWSCYWDDHKATPKVKETFVTPTKSTLCSEPATNFKDTSRDCIADSNLETNHSEDINVNNSSKDSTLSLKNSNSPSFSEDIENIKPENKFINSVDEHVKERQDFNTLQIKDNNAKGIPKVTSIEKTNINISNVIMGNQSSVNQELCQNFVTNEFIEDANNKLICLTNNKVVSDYLPESEKLLNSEPFNNNKFNDEVAMTEYKLNANMMETDNTPPITVSIKVPTSLISENTISSIQQINCKNNGTGDITSNVKKSSTSEMKYSSVKRNVTSGKLYEKFSFSAIKNKIKNDTTIDTKSDSMISLRSNSKVKDAENDATCSARKENSNKSVPNNKKTLNCKNNHNQRIPNTNVTCDNPINQSNDSIMVNNSSNQGNRTSDTSMLNTSVNIDTVLDELLNNDHSVSEDINDEWINSLLS